MQVLNKPSKNKQNAYTIQQATQKHIIFTPNLAQNYESMGSYMVHHSLVLSRICWQGKTAYLQCAIAFWTALNNNVLPPSSLNIQGIYRKLIASRTLTQIICMLHKLLWKEFLAVGKKVFLEGYPPLVLADKKRFVGTGHGLIHSYKSICRGRWAHDPPLQIDLWGRMSPWPTPINYLYGRVRPAPTNRFIGAGELITHPYKSICGGRWAHDMPL